VVFLCCFLFQAEDGIRDDLVTGSSDVCSSDLPPGECPFEWGGRLDGMNEAAWRPRPGGRRKPGAQGWERVYPTRSPALGFQTRLDRKSTRLNSSHQIISYAVFCLKKKKKQPKT